MTALLLRARNGLFVTAIGLMLVSLLAPAVTLADTSLAPGSAAVVAGTNGDGVSLRSDMSTNAPALQTVPEGTPLQILDGPLTAADGSVWYSVSVNGTTGYVAAEFVAGASDNGGAQGNDNAQGDAAANTEPTAAATEAPQEPVTGPAASTIPWKQAIAYGVVNDNIGQGVPDAGIVCRADVSASAAEITQVNPGDTVEITGEQIQSEGLTWYPVNCAGVGGFIDANWVQVTSQDQSGDAAPQDQTDPNAQAQQTEAPTEVATEAPTEVATVAPTEAPAQVETVAPTEAPNDVQDVQNGDQQTGDQQAQAPEQTAPPTEAPVENTPEVAVTEAPTDSTDVPATDAPATDAPATEAATTAAPAETQTEAATDTTETQAATVEVTAPATENSGDQPATESTTEAADGTPAATVAPTEANATPAATQTSAATQSSDKATQPAAATDPATGPAEATQTADATQPATETAAATKTATQDATATAAAPTKEAAASTPAADTTSTPTTVPTQVMTTEKATPAVDLSQAIGSAEVKGTNGDGVRCRVSPADGAATITVLAEGTKVSVMGMPSNGWLPVACGEQIGYTNLQYMWQGGAVQGDFSSGDTGASVKVQGTGNGLNCRTGASTDNAVITVVFDGTNLVIRGMPRGSWLPVVCGGQNGYVSIDYVSAPRAGTSGGGTSNVAATASGSATVTGTGGDGLRCRTGASTGSAVITVLADGSRVTTRGAASNGWVPVVCGGQNGYIYAQYANVSGGSTGSNGGSSGGNTGGTATSGSVVVTGTGNGLNCRTGASTSNGVITVVFDGTTLKVRGAATNGWLPVVCGGQNGYVSSDWVKSSGGSSGSTGSTGGSSGSTSGGSKVTGSAKVTGTGGDGVRCRTGASTSNATIIVVGEGQTVSLRGGASNGWQPVVCGGQNGYISAQYLSATGSSSGDSGSGSNSGATGGLGNGAHARVTDVLNLRYEPSLSAGIATAAPAGTVVLITGGATNGYYPVDWDGLKGYMAGDYLAKTDAALSKRGGSAADPDPAPSTGDSGGSATGSSLVSYAMGYVGYPYVWATHGPASFDCSGFTYWVVKNVLGINIGTGLWTQVAAGTPVSRSALQPGDLVFFQNTYEPGLSHVGIYIGGGKFVHAENETTGVKISDLGSDYYSSRWYGAVRLG